MDKPDKDKLDKLTPEQYNVCILKGTEAPFTGKYNDHKESGVYTCVVCGNKLFKSQDKFDSGSGWPSYLQPYSDSAIIEQVDNSHGMQRVEVLCHSCGAHLGHVFPDGPPPTNLRFCINSAALSFIKDDAK